MSANTSNNICDQNGQSGFNESTFNKTCASRQLGFSPFLSTEARVSLIAVYCLIFALGFLGNALVLYIIGKKRELTGGDTFILSLAFADLLASVFVPVLVIHDLVSNLKWQLGAAMCKILPSISPVTLIVSSWSLVLIAIDRYRVIKKPLAQRISQKLKCAAVVFSWIFAVLLSLPYTLSQKIHNEHLCIEDFNFMDPKTKSAYVCLWLFVGWIMPLFAVSIIYCLCSQELQRNHFGKETNDTTRKRAMENRRVVKLFVTLVSMFAILTLPYSVFYITVHFVLTYLRKEANFDLIWTLNYLLFVLTNINSCTNPLIYAKMHKEINSFAGKAWRRIRCIAKSPADNRSMEASFSDMKTTIQSSQYGKNNKEVEQKFTNKAFSDLE
ncbi:C3a anaphylatoxin chemotactic receptor-like [Rhopilema esculentum]|uniref:C3a anaphylatoxin chemotactic receptor-like n=1 Tax=Rhopilema esculentum TaxID=499914 RepID=UPI0031CEB4AB|eukprot:gene2531-726_t